MTHDNDNNFDVMLAHSYRNFHVKGFDYLCLKRTPEHTRKVYFFEGNVAHLSEVVNPHDHRYHFETTVLTGVMSNSTYEQDDLNGNVYNEFEWRTPLLGGDGFHWKRETRLFERQRFFYKPGDRYAMRAEELHTIRMHADTTVIVLDQYADVVPESVPTKTFMQERSAPSTDGLYDKFKPEELRQRLKQYQQLVERVA